jgi:CDP-glucose 4,6-dehydratase
VLEPLSGYLTLAAAISHTAPDAPLCSGFNFGPNIDSNRSVRAVVEQLLKHWPGKWDDRSTANAPHEAGRLHLSTDKAYHLLHWQPVWGFADTIAQTGTWYRENNAGTAAAELTTRQLREYVEQARQKELQWATR